MSLKKTFSFRLISILFVMALIIIPAAALAQDAPELSLRLSRDFGYGGMGNDIQGLFSMRASGPDDLQRVNFFIDDQSIGEVSETPFRLQFNTDKYPLGEHRLSAVGYTSSGQELNSNVIVVDFVSPEEGWETAGRIVIPLLALVFGLMAVSFLITFINVRRHGVPAPGEPRNYGISGGTICSKCERPFPLSLLGLNLLTRRLERCPYCGKWSLVQRRSMDELRRAEQAELERAQADEPKQEMSEEERLRKDLDNSRFSG